MQTPQSAPRIAITAAWATLASLVLYFELSKGAIQTVQDWGAVYWWLDYGDGMVRRGLMGQLFQAGFGELYPDGLRRPVLWLHWSSLVLIAGTMVALSSLVIWRLAPRDRLVFVAIAGWFLASQLWATLSYNVGYLDSYVLALALAAALLLSRGRIVPAGLVMAVAPFLHEYFLFLTPFVLAAGWRPREDRRVDPSRPLDVPVAGPGPIALVILALIPIVATAIILLTSGSGAAEAQLATMPVKADQKATLLEVQLGQGVGGATLRMIDMLTTNIDYNLANFAFFLLPALVLTGGIVWWKAPRGTLAPWLQAAAGLFPASALLVAWDLSRLLVMTSFTAGALFLLLAVRRTAADAR